MSGAQARSQKTKVGSKLTTKSASRATTKAASKVTGHGVIVAAKSKQGNSGVRPGSSSSISAQELQMLVARAAYLRAEKRGFVPGGELQDWVDAEAEVLRLTGGA